MKRIRKLLLVFVLGPYLIAGCGGGGGSQTSSKFDLAGHAQKGPLIAGSTVTASVLDASLNSTGQTYLTSISDNLGTFTLSNLPSNLVSILCQGYYLDEITGQVSSGGITLKAIVDLSVTAAPTVNVLTTLQLSRLTTLIANGSSYSAAVSQSQTEVLAAFGINSSKISGFSSVLDMDFNGTSDQDAVLVAISAILAKMATINAVANGTTEPGELSILLTAISTDIQRNGAITNTTNQNLIKTASGQLDLASIRANIQNYYVANGVTMIAPKFEEWVDSDQSGVLPRRLLQVTGLGLTDITTADAFTTVTSNTVTIGGIGTGISALVLVDDSTTIIKNGTVLSTKGSTVVDGDELAFIIRTGAIGSTVSPSISVGSTALVWHVATRLPTIMYDTGAGTYNIGGVGGAFVGFGYIYSAFPIIPTATFTAGYIGIENTSGGTISSALSVYSDDNGSPGALMATTTDTAQYFSGITIPLLAGGSRTTSSPHQFYFGGTGFSFSAGVRYWIVMKSTGWEYDRNDLFSIVPFSIPYFSNDAINWTPQDPLGVYRTPGQIPVMPDIWITN